MSDTCILSTCDKPATGWSPGLDGRPVPTCGSHHSILEPIREDLAEALWDNPDVDWFDVRHGHWDHPDAADIWVEHFARTDQTLTKIRPLLGDAWDRGLAAGRAETDDDICPDNPYTTPW